MPSWEDYVTELESLEATKSVTPHKEEYQISVKYSRSVRHFEQATEYIYNIQNKPSDRTGVPLRVEPAGNNGF